MNSQDGQNPSLKFLNQLHLLKHFYNLHLLVPLQEIKKRQIFFNLYFTFTFLQLILTYTTPTIS